MKNMENSDLERFIDEQLRRLPDREAPVDLVSHVLAAIARQEALPWYRLPFTRWPLIPRIVLLEVLLGTFGVVAYLVSGPAGQVTISALYEKAASATWFTSLVRVSGNAMVTLIQGVTGYWIAVAVAVVLAMYGACIAGGVALYKITSTHSLQES